jgi:hypothetical protein
MSSQAATSVFPPIAFNTSSSSARPIAPIIPAPNVPKGNLAAQPKVPPGRQPLNASANAFSSLSQSASRFAASPGSSANAVQNSLFDSASRKQNAFYQPPPALPPAPFPAFNEVSAAEGSRALPRDNADVEMDQGDDVESQMGREDPEPGEDESLAYSVFGSKPIRSSKRAGTQTRQAPVEAKKVPPGAFVTEDDHEPEIAEPPPPPSRQTRRATATKTSTAKPAKAPATRTRKRAKEQEQELSRALPGSLMESEDGSADEADEEDGDQLAPLPPRQGTAAEGVPTRRRSSRLSSSSDTESSEKKKAPGRTRTATTGAGRKRRT